MLFLQNVQFALRVYGKDPRFTAVAVLTLAFGIGGNAAIFSLVDDLIVRDLPVRDPKQLVSLFWSTSRFKDQAGFSIRDYEAFQSAKEVLSEVAGVRLFQRVRIEWNGSPEMASGEYVTGNYFSMLGVQPVLGRLIDSTDEAHSRDVVVLSFGCWQRRFGGNRSVIGSSIRIESRPMMVIGVSPPGFFGLSPGYSPDFRMPVAALPQPGDERKRQTDFAYTIWGRLRDGVSRQRAELFLQRLYAAREQEKAKYVPESDRARFRDRKAVLHMRDAHHGLLGLNTTYAKPLQIVFVLTGLVLLAACINIAGLLLSQAERRRLETAIRVSLGASRGQIASQFLVESLMLSVFGSLMAMIIAAWSLSLISSLIPWGGFGRFVPVEIGSAPTLRSTLFLAGLCVLTAVLFGTIPAIRAAHQETLPVLKSMESGSFLGRWCTPRNFLLAGQIALSLFLILGATTFVSTLQTLQKEDPGYQKDKLLLITLDPTKGRYRHDNAHELLDQLMLQLKNLPGVASISMGRYNPLEPTFAVAAMKMTIEGYQSIPEEDHPRFWPVRNVISPRYFETLQIPLLRGRDFTNADGPNSGKVAIINDRFAKHYFGNADPLGRRIGWNGRADFEIIGVAGNAKYESLREQPKPYWYIPYAQLGPSSWQQMTIQARVTSNESVIAQMIRKEVAAIDSSLPVLQISTLDTEVNYHLVRERMMAMLGGFFGILATLLAGIGTYGVVSYAVNRRTREFGIRLALGARRSQIARMLLGEIAVTAVVGLVAGSSMLWTGRKLISSFVYGIEPTDARIISLGILVITGVVLAAAWSPLRRASNVNPMTSLRYD